MAQQQRDRVSDPVHDFFNAAVREFIRMTTRGANKGHPWTADDKASGLVLVAAYVYSPRWDSCVEGIHPKRLQLIQQSVATAYADTPQVHGKLPEPFDEDSPILTDYDWWEEELAKAEEFIKGRNERRAAQGPRPGGSVKPRSGKANRNRGKRRDKPQQSPQQEQATEQDAEIGTPDDSAFENTTEVVIPDAELAPKESEAAAELADATAS